MVPRDKKISHQIILFPHHFPTILYFGGHLKCPPESQGLGKLPLMLYFEQVLLVNTGSEFKIGCKQTNGQIKGRIEQFAHGRAKICFCFLEMVAEREGNYSGCTLTTIYKYYILYINISSFR